MLSETKGPALPRRPAAEWWEDATWDQIPCRFNSSNHPALQAELAAQKIRKHVQPQKSQQYSAGRRRSSCWFFLLTIHCCDFATEDAARRQSHITASAPKLATCLLEDGECMTKAHTTAVRFDSQITCIDVLRGHKSKMNSNCLEKKKLISLEPFTILHLQWRLHHFVARNRVPTSFALPRSEVSSVSVGSWCLPTGEVAKLRAICIKKFLNISSWTIYHQLTVDLRSDDMSLQFHSGLITDVFMTFVLEVSVPLISPIALVCCSAKPLTASETWSDMPDLRFYSVRPASGKAPCETTFKIIAKCQIKCSIYNII